MQKKCCVILSFLLCINGIFLFLMRQQQNAISRWKRQAEKKKGQFMVMDQWVRIRQEGKSLISYFQKNQYKKIVICGMSHIGKRLLKELKDSGIEVVCGLDRNAKNISEEVRVVTLAAKIPDIDVVVVTLVEGFDDVYDVLTEKVHCPVISIEDVINAI